MSDIVQQVAIPALEETGSSYLLDPRSDSVVIPYETADGGRFLLYIRGDDERQEAIISANVVEITQRQRARVALLLAELNCQFRFVTFSLDDGAVFADVCVELAYTDNAAALIQLSIDRLMSALSHTQARICRVARGRQRRARPLREAEKILDDLEFDGHA